MFGQVASIFDAKSAQKPSSATDGTAPEGGTAGATPDACWPANATYLGYGPKGVYDLAVDATALYWSIDGVETGDAGVWKIS